MQANFFQKWCISFLLLHIYVRVSTNMLMYNMYLLLSPQYGTTSSMFVSLSQSLAQNLGIQWDPAAKRSIHETHLVYPPLPYLKDQTFF